MKRYFLDTGYLIALEAVDDQYHDVAFQHWTKLLLSPFRVLTTTYVIDEVVTYFNSRQHHAKAVEIGNRLLHSPSVTCLHVDEELFYRAWAYFQDHRDKRYSLTDCVSFVVMKQEDIQIALTFDKHFLQAGFRCLP